MVLFGIGQGVMPMVGYNLGAKLYDRTRRIVQAALIFAWLIGALSGLIIVTMPDQILSLFTADVAFRQIAIPAVRIFALSLLFVGSLLVGPGINMFIGMGKGLTALLLLFLRDGILLVPCIYGFNHLYGLMGVWYAQLFSVALGSSGSGGGPRGS